MFARVEERFSGRRRPRFQAAPATVLLPEGTFDSLAELARLMIQVDAVVIDVAGRAGLWTMGGPAAWPCSSGSFSDSVVRPSIDDLGALTNPLVARSAGFGFHVTVPVRLGEEIVGKVVLLDRAMRDIDARELELLRRVAALVTEGLVLRLGNPVAN